jgi:hypothetical protein
MACHQQRRFRRVVSVLLPTICFYACDRSGTRRRVRDSRSQQRGDDRLGSQRHAGEACSGKSAEPVDRNELRKSLPRNWRYPLRIPSNPAVGN